ncbi:hypothetical protein [Dongia rigui]|uniref:Uncharacterized protein n=1 Tax=Dongia rigui TaxID=940149 RepID=A0ABU5E0Q4_9PROT|nr:hypothetical protein [Dongia rigui]MDY0873120.1 hypothetical protein [Dongia rigui]
MDSNDLKSRIVALEAIVASLLAERRVDHELSSEDRHEATIDVAGEHVEALLGVAGTKLVDRIGDISNSMIHRFEPVG